MSLMVVLGVGLVIAFVVLIVMVAVSTRSNAVVHRPAPDAVGPQSEGTDFGIVSDDD